LDLGQAADFSALCVVEKTRRQDEGAPRPANHYALRHFHRWPLGSPYTQIVRDVREMVARPALDGCTLVIDGTGVGRAVVDLFKEARLGRRLQPVVITAGRQVVAAAGDVLNVPKLDLCSCLQALLQAGGSRLPPRSRWSPRSPGSSSSSG
jgi:hypothetical protein